MHELVTRKTGVKPVATMSGASFARSGGKLLEPVMYTTCERPLPGSTQLGSAGPPSPPSLAGGVDPASGVGGGTSPPSASLELPHSPSRWQLLKGTHWAVLH